MEKAGVTEFWEVGAGKALSGMIKRTAANAATRAIGSPDDIAALKA
jgi:[acyl-carrier-protein] S-malonyltransferase